MSPASNRGMLVLTKQDDVRVHGNIASSPNNMDIIV